MFANSIVVTAKKNFDTTDVLSKSVSDFCWKLCDENFRFSVLNVYMACSKGLQCEELGRWIDLDFLDVQGLALELILRISNLRIWDLFTSNKFECLLFPSLGNSIQKI